MTTQNKTKTLTTCAMMVALASILSIFPKFNGMWPNGGSITVCSMLPIILIAYMYGAKWGFMSASAFALIQLMSDLRGIAGADVYTTFAIIFLDYIVAFVVLGFGGVFKGKFKNAGVELCLGSILAISLRFVTHFISGFLLFGSYAEWFFTQEGFTLGNTIFATFGDGTALYAIYSLMYNASYLLPEMIMTGVVAYIIGKQGLIEKLTK